jgi:uncharacterized coiled-coil protein SlyX
MDPHGHGESCQCSCCTADRRIAVLQARVAELERLAYLGEHHFPDLTWQARCEELRVRMAELEDKLEEIRRRVADSDKHICGICAHRVLAIIDEVTNDAK